MALTDLYKKNFPKTANANIKGGDKEPIGADTGYKPSKDLSKNEKALTKARRGVIGQGTPSGYTPTKTYSSLPKK